MATSNPKLPDIYTVTAKILHKESGKPLPDLLVALFDIDNFTDPENKGNPQIEAVGLSASNILVNNSFDIDFLYKNGNRLFSDITDANGKIFAEITAKDFNTGNENEQKPDIVLIVLAPEEPSLKPTDRLLYFSTDLRLNAGHKEAFIIKLDSELLKKKGIEINPQSKASNSVNTYIAGKEEQKQIQKEISEYNKKQIEEEKAERGKFRSSFRKAIKTDPSALIKNGLFVDENTTIKIKQEEAYDEGLKRLSRRVGGEDDDLVNATEPVPGKGVPINLLLSQTDFTNFEQYKIIIGTGENTKLYFDIPEKEIQKLLFKRESAENFDTLLVHNNPISKFCREKTSEEKCAEDHVLKSTPTPNPSHSDTNPEEITESNGITLDDIPKLLEKILKPEKSVINPTKGRPTAADVQQNIDSFSLSKSPADVTAFHDFHSLQIAFQHVWTQLLDETLVNLGERAENALVNSGRPGISQAMSVDLTGEGGIHAVFVDPTMGFNGLFPTTITPNIAAVFDISLTEFAALSGSEAGKLSTLATQIISDELDPRKAEIALRLREQGERIIDNLRLNKPYSAHQILKDLHDRLLSKYEFTVFAANRDYHAVNFGLMNTYRQKWEPLVYQVGRLVKTIPLAPKEERKYSIKTVANTKSVIKEAQKNSSTIHNEQNITNKADVEIIRKATDKTNFTMSSDGNINLGIYSGDAKTSFGVNADKESTETRKDFREAVIKASQEYKNERNLDIETEATFNSEFNESGTITNPNDELAVTYLFYELQRRYRISECIYRVMPVVLVAQVVPSPDQITEAWIMANAWILNRFILDDSFRYALNYLTTKNVGDEFALRELHKNVKQQRHLVERLKIELSKLRLEIDNRYYAFEKAISARIDEEHRENTDGVLNDIQDWAGYDLELGLVGGLLAGPAGSIVAGFEGGKRRKQPDPEAAKARELAASDAHRSVMEKAEKMAAAIQQESNTLRQLTNDYVKAMRDHLDCLTKVKNLIVHIKENIFYYMQAIWSMEPPDQRYLRLYKVQVPQFEATRTCLIEANPAEDIFETFREAGTHKHKAWLRGKVNHKADGTLDITYKPLVEVADLDTVLGYKGNCMIFPMKRHNALTEFMAAPYVDASFGAMDPDEFSNVNLEEFSKYICCLHDEAPAEYERLKPVLKKWLERLLADPLRNGDEIIIPTGSLFIEMLPSGHTLLEDFKLKHRELDVRKVQEEVQMQALENIRLTKRILEDKLEDPKIDKKIVVEGNIGTNIDVDNN
jgi:hypothetical protein